MKSRVSPIIDYEVRRLCCRPYPGHPKGCPNYGKRKTCPPGARILPDIIDMTKPIYALWTVFDFGSHVTHMKNLHPDWSRRQLECCLYWQGSARKNLEIEIRGFNWDQFLTNYGDDYEVVRCPEACGVNVTATMKSLGEILEWPPTTKTYQVAIAGYKKGQYD